MYCTSCGTKNKEEALFCTKCGKKLKTDQITSTKEKPENAWDEKIDEHAERFGVHFERRMNQWAKQFETWPDRTFGIAGPLIGSFIGLIILWIISTLLQRGGPTMIAIGEIFYNNLLVIFGLFLVGNYNSYVYRHYKNQYRWISPAISTVVFIGWLWIIAKILTALSEGLDITFLGTLGEFINTFLIAIFVVILLFSYGIMMTFFYGETPDQSKES